MELQCYTKQFPKKVYSNLVILRDENLILDAFISMAYSFCYSRGLLFLIPSYFRIVLLVTRGSAYLAVYERASARRVSTGIVRIISYHLPTRREGMKLWGWRTVVMVTGHIPRYPLISGSGETWF